MAARMLVASLCIVCACVVVCAQSPSAEERGKEKPKEDERIELPWSIDQLKKGVKKGMSMLLKMEDSLGEKTITSYHKMEVTEVADETYTLRQTSLDAEKKELAKPIEAKKKWGEYMAAFRFSKSTTEVADEKIKVGAGEFACKVFKRSEKLASGETVTTTIWLATEKPGVLVKATSSGGKTTSVWTLEEYSAGK
jgi:hypothetical protein